MKRFVLVALCAALTQAAGAWEIRQVFCPERFCRGNTNLRLQQPADTADWIWIADAEPIRNEMEAVRFSCAFSGAGEPVTLDVSGDERFVLFLDGREIARGPHKGIPSHWYYQTYVIQNLATNTTHHLEAVVYRMGHAAPKAVMTTGQGGFLVKASGVYDARLTTGKGPWRAARVRGTWMTDYGDSEGFAGGAQSVVCGTGFLDPAAAGPMGGVRVVRRRVVENEYGFARSGWLLFPTERPDQMAVVRRPGAFKAGQPFFKADTNRYYRAEDAAFARVADMNALLSARRALTVPARTSMRLVWDLGDYYCAYPSLSVSGGKGAEIRWGWAESLYDRTHARADRGAFAEKRCAHAMRDTFFPDGRVQARFTTPWWRCGRWCEFEVRTADAPVTLTDLSMTEVRYPLESRASFSCDDPSVSAVWRLCRRGLENCMHETYMDCPYFEQQMYPGDTRIVMLIVNALSGDPRMNRYAAGLFDYGRRDDGLVPMNFPCRTDQSSSSYSLCWTMMLNDYVRWQGTDAWLKARLPGMRHTLHAMCSFLDQDGLFVDAPGWSFQDWSTAWSFFGTAPDGTRGVSAVNNLLLVYALALASETEEAAGDRAMASYWRAKKDALAEAVMKTFWCEPRGLIADTAKKDCFSEHAQCLALLADILPPARETRVLKGLLDAPDLARTSVYFSHYLFDVLMKYGHADRFLKRLDLWRDYVETGLKTPLEAPGLRARSDCHAWGSHPIYHLLTGVAGIKPDSPGFRSVRLAPQPGGLKRIHASMPTPQGMISMDLRFTQTDVEGMVVLPEGLPGTFVWKGRTRTLAAGVNRLSPRD